MGNIKINQKSKVKSQNLKVQNKDIKRILLFGILGLQLWALKPALNCRDFLSDFHFSSFDLKLQLEEAIHNDVGLSIVWVRFFHNKLTFFVLDIFRRLLMFWDFKVLLAYLLPAGLFGFLSGIYCCLNSRTKKERKRLFFALCYLLFASLFEIIFSPQQNFFIKLLLFVVPLQLFSVFGLLKLMEKRSAFIIAAFLLISFWWLLVFPNEFSYFCVK